MLPRPKTRVPSHTIATLFHLEVYSYTSFLLVLIASATAATPGCKSIQGSQNCRPSFPHCLFHQFLDLYLPSSRHLRKRVFRKFAVTLLWIPIFPFRIRCNAIASSSSVKLIGFCGMLPYCFLYFLLNVAILVEFSHRLYSSYAF